MHFAKRIKQCLMYAVLWTVSAGGAVADPVVSTGYGSLKGKLSSVKGTDRVVHEYLGIPFAKPPLGSLRFSAPQPSEPWDGIRDATNQPAMCLQDMQYTAQLMEDLMLEFPVPATSEDCLYLNIYTPGEAATKEARLPVMVWIHGGGLMIGAASQYDGSALAAYENVVVVVIQYRLGILGFLSTGDEHARGNWGFLDQVAALRWVQENIKSFGGDPNSVTIFGESAGGCSVSAHILSPLSSSLFHKAISESGVATLPGLITSNPQPITKMIANATGCDYTDSATLVKCLREKNDEVLVNASKLNIMPLGTVDGVFFPSTLEEILKEKRFHKVPYLLGITNHEFGWLLPKTFSPPGWEEGMHKEKAIAVLNMIVPVKLLGPGVNERIAAEYFKDTEDPVKLRDLFTEMLGDVFMVLPTIIAANYHKEAGVPVYLYEFQHRPSIYKDKRPSFVKADHADEIGFVFGSCFWNGHIKVAGTMTEGEMKLCRVMMAYWANFARNGTPNGDGLVHWPVYDKNEEYMALGLEQKSGKKLKGDIMKFLTNLLSEKN
ncbi:carboxylesterase 5A-like [Acipenser oxyrinchus oxyrinchus]|uniref:Carboxylic ester hydrolase n=1 Tax=Acipenser oxyrinchus oxyrinchus TaxID=40147 RepID=A0AAD8D4K6_ACIOX|nr:carboxylesterase 5A-like [Acipenser oxyrinchus oxyrinchus]